MNRAVKLLAAKPRCVGELRERLLEKMWTDEQIVDGVIAAIGPQLRTGPFAAPTGIRGGGEAGRGAGGSARRGSGWELAGMPAR